MIINSEKVRERNFEQQWRNRVLIGHCDDSSILPVTHKMRLRPEIIKRKISSQFGFYMFNVLKSRIKEMQFLSKLLFLEASLESPFSSTSQPTHFAQPIRDHRRFKKPASERIFVFNFVIFFPENEQNSEYWPPKELYNFYFWGFTRNWTFNC